MTPRNSTPPEFKAGATRFVPAALSHGHLSSIPRQLPAAPMMLLPVRIERALDVAVNARLMPIRANIVRPPGSATSIRLSIAACHSAVRLFLR
jgi:hypothetical protein